MADFSISTVITADSSNFDKNVKKAGKSLDGFSSNIKSVTKLLGGLFAITSITALAKSIKDVSTEFSKATANIAKGTGATGEALQNLSKSVNNAMIQGVGRSASEVGSMIADLNTRFGVTDKTLERMVDNFDKFASVTDTEVKTSINSVADLMAKWNVSLEDSDKLLDQLTVASQMSGASVTELSAGLKTGQSVLSQFGMSLTESTAFLASLSKNGVATGVALTGLRTALANFSADGKEAGSAFQEVARRIKNARTQTEALQIATETFGTRSGAEMVKVLQTSATSTEEFTQALRNAGGALEETDRASRTSQDALEDLKATIQATFFSSGADTGLRDMIDGIAEAFRNINFAELKEQFSSIGLFLQGVWEQFKELFNNIKEAIDISGTNFGSWKEVIYNHLNAVYRILQDWVGGFSALLKGDFSLAWDYAKLALMRTADYMIDILSKLANSMPELINKMIDGLNAGIEKLNEGLALIGKAPVELIKHIDHVDLSDALGLDESIRELEKKIEQATGKVADKTLQDLKNISNNVKSTTKEINTYIGSIGATTDKTGKKIEQGAEKASKSWFKLSEQLKTDAEDWSDVTEEISSGIESVAMDSIESIGANLVEGEDAWENYGAMALKSIAKILEALAMQLSTLAVVNIATYNYGKALVASAGAVTALAGAGALKSLSNSMNKVASATESATTSLEDFKNTLDSIWSDKGSTSSFLLAFRKNQNVIEAQADLVDELQDKYIQATKEYDAYLKKWGTETFSGQYVVRRTETWYKLKEAYESALNDFKDANKNLTEAYEAQQNALKEEAESIKAQNTLLKETIDLYEVLYETSNVYSYAFSSNWDFLIAEQEQNILSLAEDLYGSLSETGQNIGETLIDNIIDGATKEDFAESLRDYIRENMIKLTILTDDFSEELAKISVNLNQAMLSGSESQIARIKKELDSLYDESLTKVEEVNSIMSSVFGDITETVTEDTETGLKEINDYLEKLQVLIGDFEEEVGGVGTDIANSLISGIEEGLTNSDFIDNMYNYIRKMIIQTVVYTESMQTEIESIGWAISYGLSNGFRADSLDIIKQDLSSMFDRVSKQMTDIDSLLGDVFGTASNATEELTEDITELEETLADLITANLTRTITSAYEELENAGSILGKTLIKSIVKGAEKSDFLSDMKNYLTEHVIALTVYTDEFSSRLAEVGEKMAQAITDGTDLSSVRTELEALWNEATELSSTATAMLEDVFGDLAEEVEETSETVTTATEEIEKELTKLESAITNFKESVTDLGGDIANNLISGLSNGLTDSDFLETMYSYIRKLIVQTVVYTESMKSEIEAIGQTISEGLSSGFSADSLSTIRRDLSYIFYSANQQMAGIDSLLDSVFKGYASGTENASRGLHLVGEAGPELVAFNGGEKVYNAEETSRMLNGGNNFNVTFNNTQDTTAFAMMQQLRQYNREMAINGIF